MKNGTIEDISSIGEELSPEELRLTVGAGEGGGRRGTVAATYDSAEQMCTVDRTPQDAPILD
jgi:hypothetical protein